MIVLGIDCSSRQSSVCITREGEAIYTAVQNTTITHSQNLLPMVQAALSVCALDINCVDLFAVTVGPGSFTGIRIGLGLVKGMASAANTPCVGVSSLTAMAKAAGLEGVTIACFDARRNQVYCNITENGRMVQEDCCCLVDDLAEFVENCQENVFFVGDGSDLCYNRYEKFHNVKKHSVKLPCIALGACLLAQKETAVTHFELTPSYLRLTQAEQELRERQK
ncbi:MAG: tRNA (adenosine(37)-N6)-threonylcarbamoyltransferase complex dimerization subunit type 1 TsaB [Oscillospiraceae bacterium]